MIFGLLVPKRANTCHGGSLDFLQGLIFISGVSRCLRTAHLSGHADVLEYLDPRTPTGLLAEMG